MKIKNNPLTIKLKEWIDGQSDYEMRIEYDYSDFSDGGKHIQIWKKRVHPKPKNERFVRNCIIDTHYYVITVHTQRKLYNIGDNRMFSEYVTVGLTFEELIKSITDDSCGYDYTLIVGKFDGGLRMSITPNGMKPKMGFYSNGKRLTKENMKGTVL